MLTSLSNLRWSLLLVIAISSGCAKGGPLAETLTSPHGRYTVSISGILESPSNPLVDHVVSFVVNGREPAGSTWRGELYRSDWFDDGFRELYPSRTWISENALRFVTADRKSERGRRLTLLLRNTSGKPLAFVRVLFGDLFLIIDLTPGATTAVVTTSYLPDREFVSVTGKFMDGTLAPVLNEDALFSKGESPITFIAAISERSITLVRD